MVCDAYIVRATAHTEAATVTRDTKRMKEAPWPVYIWITIHSIPTYCIPLTCLACTMYSPILTVKQVFKFVTPTENTCSLESLLSEIMISYSYIQSGHVNCCNSSEQSCKHTHTDCEYTHTYRFTQAMEHTERERECIYIPVLIFLVKQYWTIISSHVN